jgi:hypothetical protein
MDTKLQCALDHSADATRNPASAQFIAHNARPRPIMNKTHTTKHMLKEHGIIEQDQQCLICASDKELNALLNAAYPVKSLTHNQYQAIRREMYRRGLMCSA